MLKLTIDLKQIRALRKQLAGIKPRMAAAQAEALNLGGARLFQLAEQELAREYGVSVPMVALALDGTNATSSFPTYVLRAVNEDFPFLRWVTQRDEKVCKICGPRDGSLFRIYDSAALLPAHPNCRCYWEHVDVGGSLKKLSPRILPEPMQIATDHFMQAFASHWND